MKRYAIMCLAISMLLCLTSLAFAGTNWGTTKGFTVTAIIPQLTTGMNGDLSKVVTTQANCATAPTYSWTPGQTAINFGTLTWDTTNSIFRAGYAYALDVGVLNNVATGWTITHTRTNLAKGTDNLNANVNVVFQKIVDDLDPGTDIYKVSYANSNGKTITKSQVSGGWLRIWYGIATGNTDADQCADDAPSVLPIGMSKPYGTYTGTITLTLVTT